MDDYLSQLMDIFQNGNLGREILFYVIILTAGWVFGKILSKRSVKAATNEVPGLPILGSSVALGRHGAAFVAAARKKHGDSFFFNLPGGQQMEFWHDPLLINTFFSSPDELITFRPAVEQFTQRVFGLPSKEFFPVHSKVLQELRHLLVPGLLAPHADKLAVKINALLPTVLPEGQDTDLYAAVKKIVFRAALEVLFGDTAPTALPGYSYNQLQDDLFAFEAGFEMAASPIPHLFQPTFTGARARLLAWLKAAGSSGAMDGTPAAALLEKTGLRPELRPNLGLAMLWASQANTVPSTFWALGFLLLPQHTAHKQAVLSELGAEMKSIEAEGGVKGVGSSSKDALVAAACKLASDRKSAVSKCVAEAIRLRVQSIDVRIAAADLELPTSKGDKVRVPKGRILAVCPFVSHHDPALYPNPDVFDPNRAPLTLPGDGTAVVTSVGGLAFGGGPYRCPGRFFAEMEVAVAVQLVLAQRDIALLGQSKGPKPSAVTSSQQQQQQQQQGQTGVDLSLLASIGEAFAISILGLDLAFWGLGVLPPTSGNSSGSNNGGNSSSQAGTSQSAALPLPLEDWRHSGGDVDALLPPCDLKKLVGVKTPAGPCWAAVRGVTAATAVAAAVSSQ